MAYSLPSTLDSFDFKLIHFSSVTFVWIGVQRFPVGFKRSLQHVYFDFKVLDAIYLNILQCSVIFPHGCVSATDSRCNYAPVAWSILCSETNHGIDFNVSRVINRVPCRYNCSKFFLRKPVWFHLLIVFSL